MNTDSDTEDDEQYYSYDAKDRIGTSLRLGVSSIGNQPKYNLPDIEIFSIDTENILNFLGEKFRFLELNMPQKTKIMSMIPELSNVNHKNPTAYILGWLINNQPSKFQMIKNRVLGQRGVEESVKLADVVRYARLWKKMLA